MIPYSIAGDWCEVNTPDLESYSWLPWWLRWSLEPCQCYNCQHYCYGLGAIMMVDVEKGIRFPHPAPDEPRRSFFRELAARPRYITG